MKKKLIRQTELIIDKLANTTQLNELSSILKQIIDILPDIKDIISEKQVDHTIFLKQISRLEDILFSMEDIWLEKIKASGVYVQRDEYSAVHIKRDKMAKRVIASFYGFKDTLFYLSEKVETKQEQKLMVNRLAELMARIDLDVLELEGMLLERVSGPIF